MVFCSLDNAALHDSTVRIAGEERVLTGRLLGQLREIERRRIYLEHKCGSLHEYCTKVLKYSEGAASRRVNASRLLDAVPEIAEKVASGAVNLSTLSLAQTFIRAEEIRTRRRLSPDDRRDVVRQVEGVSQNQALRQLTEAMPQAEVHTSSTRPLKNQDTLLQIIADPEFMMLYERVRELNSHSAEFLQPKGLFKALLEEHLNRHAPERKKPKKVTQSHAAADFQLYRTRRILCHQV